MNTKAETEHRMWKRNAGLIAFFISGICAISPGIIVTHLQEQYQFDYGMTGTFISLMNIGNLIAGFLAGILPARLGMKKSVALLTIGYAIGYACMGIHGWMLLFMIAFFLLGIAKGSTINTCTILVGNNSTNRTTGMNLMHACYACGALLCPFLILMAQNSGFTAPMFLLSACGMVLWIVFFTVPMEDGQKTAQTQHTDWAFLKSRRFWLLTGLIFCQNAAETSVNNWMVSYFKGSGILTGVLSTYTVTVMWAATLIARLLIAFVFPLKKPAKAMVSMSLGCTVFYFAMILANTQTSAILLLFCFAFSMAGMNPTATSLAGRMTSVTSIGVMLPVASSGAILMPWIIGIVTNHVGIQAGMMTNIIPCAGLFLFAILVHRLPEEAP